MTPRERARRALTVLIHETGTGTVELSGIVLTDMHVDLETRVADAIAEAEAELLTDVAVPARAHHQQDEETKDVMARSGTPEIRDPQPAAVTDAGSQKDSAGPEPSR